MRVAVHISDCDGICSAALILRKYPNAEITFWTPVNIVNTDEYFDLVVDLPKPKNAKVNIDHHYTNFERLKREGRLTNTDKIDPKAPSAASLLIKYLHLEEDIIAQEIEEMASLADQGKLTNENLILDKLIKSSIKDHEFLRHLARVLSQKGKRFLEEEKIKQAWINLNKLYEQIKKVLEQTVDEFDLPARILVINERDVVPYYMAKDIAYMFFEKKGTDAVALIYNDPESPERTRISIRVNSSCDYINARTIAESLGGGGHIKAAGALFDSEVEAVAKIIDAMSNYAPKNAVVYIRLKGND